VNHVQHLFIVEMKWLVWELYMSHVTDVAEKEFQGPLADQVMTNPSYVYVFLLIVVHM
jgi:hypothetical protein